MFGKEQPDVVNEDQVGEYIDQLKAEGTQEIEAFITEENNGLEDVSTRTSTRTED